MLIGAISTAGDLTLGSGHLGIGILRFFNRSK